MNKLNKYLSIENISQSEFARRIGVTQGMIFQLLRGDRRASEKLCVRIEQATNGVVNRKDLRPDDWQDIWPELREP